MWISQKPKNIDILKTKHTYLNYKKSLVTNQGLLSQ